MGFVPWGTQIALTRYPRVAKDALPGLLCGWVAVRLYPAQRDSKDR